MDASISVIHAADLTAADMRDKLREALSTPATRVIVNFSRIPLGQQGDGHAAGGF
jgi:hypothetical protein